MNAMVDTGDIIMTSYFDITPYETIESLKLKSMNHMLISFEKILSFIIKDIQLPCSQEIWSRKPFTRKQLKELCYIDPNNRDKTDISLRIKATLYPSAPHGAYTMVGNHKFYYPIENRLPIV